MLIIQAGCENIRPSFIDLGHKVCTAADGEWHSDSEVKIDKLGYVIRNGQKTKTFWDGTIQSEKRPKRLKIRNICGDETVWTV